jgi:hypothetical protein
MNRKFCKFVHKQNCSHDFFYLINYNIIVQVEAYINNGVSWLIKVLRKGCFHNGPVMCPRSVIMALEVSVLSLGQIQTLGT